MEYTTSRAKTGKLSKFLINNCLNRITGNGTTLVSTPQHLARNLLTFCQECHNRNNGIVSLVFQTLLDILSHLIHGCSHLLVAPLLDLKEAVIEALLTFASNEPMEMNPSLFVSMNLVK